MAASNALFGYDPVDSPYCVMYLNFIKTALMSDAAYRPSDPSQDIHLNHFVRRPVMIDLRPYRIKIA